MFLRYVTWVFFLILKNMFPPIFFNLDMGYKCKIVNDIKVDMTSTFTFMLAYFVVLIIFPPFFKLCYIKSQPGPPCTIAAIVKLKGGSLFLKCILFLSIYENIKRAFYSL